MFSRRLVNMAVAFSSAAQADIINVPADFGTIQEAIDAAMDGDEVLVAPGTYIETIDFLGKAIAVRSSGGPDVTIIDAQGAGPVVTCEGGEGPGTTLQGFTVTGGFADDGGGMRTSGSSPIVTGCTFIGNAASNSGGAMFNSNSNLTVTSCAFEDNTAGNDGGAVANSNCAADFSGCTFTANSLPKGSGHFGGAVFNNMSTITMTGCTFTANVAFGASNTGGGAILSADTTETLIDCEFRDNVGFLGGALTHPEFFPPVEPLVVINCSFIDNSSGAAGALHLQSTIATLIGCEIVGNQATNPAFGFGGGVLALEGSAGPADVTVINTRISGNFAQVQGGGLDNNGTTGFALVNCTLSANQAGGAGGGISNESAEGSGEVQNCILWANTDSGGGGESAQIRVNGGQISVDHSCVEGWSGGLGGVGNIGADPLFVDPGSGNLRLSAGSPCIDAGDNAAVPQDIATDLDGTPRFLDVPETPDCPQAPDTCGDPPIVDMGAYESVGGGCLAIVSQEVVCHGDGSTFTVNVEGLNNCTGGTTMVSFTGSGGAVGEELCFSLLVKDEAGGFCCSTELCLIVPDCSTPAAPCDLDGDGVVNILDFIALLAAWGPCAPCGDCPADFDGDCAVGLTDMLTLLQDWS